MANESKSKSDDCLRMKPFVMGPPFKVEDEDTENTMLTKVSFVLNMCYSLLMCILFESHNGPFRHLNEPVEGMTSPSALS